MGQPRQDINIFSKLHHFDRPICLQRNRNENIGALARKLCRVCVFGEITALLCYFVSKGTCLIPHVPEDIEAGIAKIDITNFRLGEECLKFLLLMISVTDIDRLPGTPRQICLFKLVQVAFPWALYLCWNIEKPQPACGTLWRYWFGLQCENPPCSSSSSLSVLYQFCSIGRDLPALVRPKNFRVRILSCRSCVPSFYMPHIRVCFPF